MTDKEILILARYCGVLLPTAKLSEPSTRLFVKFVQTCITQSNKSTAPAPMGEGIESNK